MSAATLKGIKKLDELMGGKQRQQNFNVRI
jgi:hypothetical protein